MTEARADKTSLPLLGPSGFNPFRPTQHDYEALLRDVLRDLLSGHLQSAEA